MFKFNPSRLALILILLCTFNVSLADTPPHELNQELSQLFEQWKQPDKPGIAVGILREGEIEFAGGFGSANLEHQIAIDANTVFDIASVSKQFAGMSIAILAHQEKISLDADIRDYLSEVPDLGATITVRHLLHHSSGIRDWVGLMVMSGQTMEDVISFDQIMRMMERQTHTSFVPGDAVSYSNTGYNLLARIVEVVSGQSFPDWTRENLFEPLNMADTYFPADHDIVRSNRADSYRLTPNGSYKRVGNQLTALGSSSLHTTVSDLLKWLENFETGQVGGPEVLAIMTQPATMNNGDPIPYGFGLANSPWQEHKLLSHGGSWAGFKTWMGYFPDDRLGVVVLGNHAEFNSSETGMAIAQVFLGKEQTEEAPEQEVTDETEPDTALPNLDPGPVPLDDYIGFYHIAAAGFVLSVEQDDDGLFYTFLDKTPVKAIARDKFSGPGSTLLKFIRKENGSVAGLEVGMFGENFTAARLDAKADEKTSAEYLGRYYSPELDTTYTVIFRDGELFATHLRNEDIRLFPDAENEFVVSAWYMSKIEFDRDDRGQISGFRATSSRNANIVFERM